MSLYLDNSNIFANFGAWIGGSCKPSDKGKLTAFPRFKNCQHKSINVSNMLSYEELPEINSPRWLSLEDLEDEEWRPVVGFEKFYNISNYGRLKALRRWQNHFTGNMWRNERILKACKDRTGYLRYRIQNEEGKQRLYPASHLVADAFIPNTEKKPQIDHINTIRDDNRVCNLRWVTASENIHNPITWAKLREIYDRNTGKPLSEERRQKISDALKNGASSGFRMKGENHYRSIPVVQLSLDGRYIREWSCANEAMKELGGHIYSVCRGHRRTAVGYKWKFKKDYIKEEGL